MIDMIHYMVSNFTDIMLLDCIIGRFDDMRRMYPEFDIKNVTYNILEILG